MVSVGLVVGVCIVLALCALLAFTDIGRMLWRDARGAVSFFSTIGTNAGMAGPSGPVVDGTQLRMVMGEITLVAGSQTDVLPVDVAEGIPDGFPGVFPFLKNAGGVLGQLSATYTKATRTVTVTSSNAGDTSVVKYVILSPN